MTQRAPLERSQERVGEQIVGTQIKEDIVGGRQVIHQERVQNRTDIVPHLPRKKRVFLDWPRRPASQPIPGKVFSVETHSQQLSQACFGDNVVVTTLG